MPRPPPRYAVSYSPPSRAWRISSTLQYQQSIEEAKQALQGDDRSAEAWNNIGADEAALHHWDAAVEADRKAIALRTDFQLAKNNLAWALQGKLAAQKR